MWPEADIDLGKTLDGLRATMWPEGLRVSYARAYAEPTRKSEPKMDFWKLGTVIFWKSVCFFNLPFFQLYYYESYNPVCMQNHCNPPRKNKSPRSETNNPEHLNKRLRETAYAASPTWSYAICLRRTYAPSRTVYAWTMLVPPQSKFHHLEKKRGICVILYIYILIHVCVQYIHECAYGIRCITIDLDHRFICDILISCSPGTLHHGPGPGARVKSTRRYPQRLLWM